jgi:hypothetical protein
MWQGLQTITDYKEKPSHKLPSDTSIPDELNAFYARFEASNTEPCVRAPLNFAYHLNRSTDDTFSIALHTALSHLDKRKTYVRMLFIDFSSAYNTIVPSKLITKLRSLGQNTSLLN